MRPLIKRKESRLGLAFIIVGIVIIASVFINTEDKNKEELDSPQNAEIKVSTEKEIYDKGEIVNITVAFANNNSKEVTYDFSENPKLELTIYDSLENKIWNNSYKIPSGVTISAYSEYMLLDKFSWNQTNHAGEFILNGTYQIEANLKKFNSTSNTTIEIGNYIRVVTDKDVYKMDEVVNITLILVNNKNETVTYYFNDTLLWNVSIFDTSRNEVWKYPYYFAFQKLTNITLPPNSERILGNLSWSHYDRLMVKFIDKEHFENASSIIKKHNETIIEKIPSRKLVIVNVHENHTETFIEEIQKEEGVKFAEPDGDVVLNGIPVDVGKYKIHANLLNYYGHGHRDNDIVGEKYIELRIE